VSGERWHVTALTTGGFGGGAAGAAYPESSAPSASTRWTLRSKAILGRNVFYGHIADKSIIELVEIQRPGTVAGITIGGSRGAIRPRLTEHGNDGRSSVTGGIAPDDGCRGISSACRSVDWRRPLHVVVKMYRSRQSPMTSVIRSTEMSRDPPW